jgi:hypothetical protein
MKPSSKPTKSPEEKRRGARIGALAYIAFTVAALLFTMSTGSCAAESYRRANVASVVSGDARYARVKYTTCGFAREVLPGPVSAIPCQFWNLMPFPGIAVLALGWLLLDLARPGRAARSEKGPRHAARRHG